MSEVIAQPIGQTLAEELRSQALADELLAAIGRVRRAVRRRTGRASEFASLTGAQLELVRLVRRRPGLSIAAAAHELTLAPNTVSTLVGQMTAAGLLVRRLDESDRRVARLDLADAVRVKVDALRDRRVLTLAEAIAALEPDDRQRLEQGLAVLARLDGRLEDR